MSKKRAVSFENAEFKNGWRGTRIVLDHTGTEYNRGSAEQTTTLRLTDMYEALLLLQAARDAVKYFRDATQSRLNMLNQALTDQQ